MPTPPTNQSKEETFAFVERLKHEWMMTVDALVDPLMIIGEDYKIKKANKAFAQCHDKNLSIKDLIGQPCYSILANREKPCNGCQMQETVRDKNPRSWILKNIRKRYYEVTSQPIVDDNDHVTGVVQTYRDRTEAQSLQQQLNQSEKLASIGLLAGGIAHEINNPLGGIMIFSQMMLKEMPKDSPFYEDVIEIEAAAQRCKSIVTGLLEFARRQPQGKAVKKENINITEAFQSALRFAKVHPYARNTEVRETFSEAPCFSKGQRNDVVQILLNLIQNAFQSMQDGGTLNCRCFLENNKEQALIICEIEDTGSGIAEEHLDQIFDPFFTTKEPGEGTGLGLSICYGMCQDMGGELSVKSEVGIGTTFRIQFPALKEFS